MTDDEVPRATGRFDLLDGTRGVASVLVVCLHVTDTFRAFYVPPNAFLAVDFFFCLSGFIIAHSYAGRMGQDRHVGRFMSRRAVRLMPLAVFGAMLGGVVLLVRALMVGDVTLSAALLTAVLNALLLPSGSLLTAYPEAFGANPPLWSLLQEMLVSLAFALGLARLRTPGLIVLIGTAAYITIWAGSTTRTLDRGSMQIGVWFGPIRALYPFACGVLIQRLPIIPNRHGVFVAPILAALLLSPIREIGIQLTAVIFLFPLIVYVGAGARIGPHLGHMCRKLGAMSYPIYIVNYPVIRLTAMAADRLSFIDSGIAAVIAFATSLLAGYVTLQVVEPLLRRWLSDRVAGIQVGNIPPSLPNDRQFIVEG